MRAEARPGIVDRLLGPKDVRHQPPEVTELPAGGRPPKSLKRAQPVFDVLPGDVSARLEAVVPTGARRRRSRREKGVRTEIGGEHPGYRLNAVV